MRVLVFADAGSKSSQLELCFGQISWGTYRMTFQDIVTWLNTAEVNAIVTMMTIVGFALTLVFALLHFLDRRQRRESLLHLPASMAAQSPAAPKTWWEYLTNDLDLSPDAQRICANLYDIGWQQLNKPTNNREEAIADAEFQLQSLRRSLSREETKSAEELGIALAESPDDYSNDVESRLEDLSPNGQSYARLRATVRRTEKGKARDLALGIPLTDFREVKKALKEGTPPVHIIDKLPVAWRMIRTINDPKPRHKTFRKAYRPTRIRLTIQTENGIKDDDRAELDEHWVISHKLGMMLPFTGIEPVYQLAGHGKPPILKDRRMIYRGSSPPGTESRMWTRGGYLDRVLKRAAKGEDPAQLRREARRKIVRLAVLSAGIAFFIASLAYRLAVLLD